ncbi:MAG: MBL fold metallo-hydrolase [Desulfobacterales bacterium]|jgi:7,8-dihydropterin-6-yl-methyl-4-(beta-D-ribofuranosyl)aminobenzene 5'-phosphate synthase|nr:MBL fold metallo-hydrolase [Desulfobacteraceae bacterium]MDD3991837.1 MBL fold metallo-hydrolase [Desulfobacteraceae bacterium]MDY0312686.1 MBL fold metallo-hydrolase [Desulfobacterales bacterium]
MNESVKITILCEDQARMGFRDKIFLAQHGFSVFIEADRKILFDTGAGDVFARNAALAGIDLAETDCIVLSHGHWDHSDGLAALAETPVPACPLLLHPGVFVDRHKANGEYNGIGWRREQIAARFDLVESATPYRIAEGIHFLGQIPRENDFEGQATAFYVVNNHEKFPDFILDDSALAIGSPEGLVIVSGCSHAGICNIVEHARRVTGQDRVHTVLGGFHLLGNPGQLEQTIAYFKTNRVEHLYPMHCTDLPALARFHQEFGIRKLCAGDAVEIGGR